MKRGTDLMAIEVPADVSVENGLVLVDGAAGLAATLTAAAARATGERLIAAAVEILAAQAAGETEG